LKENCPQCRALRKSWYAKLKNEGFEDVELEQRTTDHKETLDLIYRKDFHSSLTFQAKTSYFLWANQMLNCGNFDSFRDKMIWEYYAEGLSHREISKRVGLERSWCTRKIKAIEEKQKVDSVCSGSMQTCLFFWAEADSPWK
jgi:hypothetical protein